MTETQFPEFSQPVRSHRRRNWPLILGLWIVGAVVVIAVLGPWLAPQDPHARTAVLQLDGRWVGPPYPPLTPGFPLGSDQAGRDLFSRLLWAVWPTLLLVLIIAAVRLVIGIVVGLAAGYATGTAQRILDGVMRVALLFPVLVVALAVIAFVGIQRGLFAFILGLALTGWAETARYVETQTRAIKLENYIESARSMGANDAHLLIYHVLRHVLPLSAMLLAFEVSSTLMVTASLGFLGYYIGGGAWITVEDWTARRVAGLPELGQMLATSFENILRPWPMVVTGGLVMIIVLGVTLVGDGLRRQLQGELELRPSPLDRLLNWAAGQLVRPAASGSVRTLPRWAWGMVVVALITGAVAAILWFSRPPQMGGEALIAPNAHPWSTQRGDAYGTLTAAESGPTNAALLWQWEEPGGFATAPVVGSDGALYAATTGGDLLAINDDGSLRWRVPLGFAPLGAPAIGPDGAIYVTDAERGLSAVSALGARLWRLRSEGRRITSGPVVGADGTIYFSRVDRVQAVNPDGSERWLSPPIDGVWEEPPRLSPTYDLIFLGLGAFSTVNGALVDLQLPITQEMIFMAPRLAVGANGQHYLMAGNTAVEWALEQGKAQVRRSITWDV